MSREDGLKEERTEGFAGREWVKIKKTVAVSSPCVAREARMERAWGAVIFLKAAYERNMFTF